MGCHLGFGETIGGSEELIGSGDSVRKARGLSQEAFSNVSSRTYMSTLERDLKKPIQKLADLCEVMEVHPLTLLTLAYAGDSTREADECWHRCARNSGRYWKSPTRLAALACGTELQQAGARSTRRREVKPDGRDGLPARGEARKPGALTAPTRHRSLTRIASHKARMQARVTGVSSTRQQKSCACGAAINSIAPRSGRDAVSGCQAAFGLLRDQIRSCVPSRSRSGGHRPSPGTKGRRWIRTGIPARPRWSSSTLRRPWPAACGGSRGVLGVARRWNQLDLDVERQGAKRAGETVFLCGEGADVSHDVSPFGLNKVAPVRPCCDPRRGMGWSHRTAVATTWRTWKRKEFVPRGMRAAQKCFRCKAPSRRSRAARIHNKTRTHRPPAPEWRRGQLGIPA